jgi:DNA polymerase I-like protein with 3'-5' exonuclease and polymerase domains
MRLCARFRDLGMRSHVIMMVHDSIWVQAPKAEEAEVRDLMKAVMTNASELAVPLQVEFG